MPRPTLLECVVNVCKLTLIVNSKNDYQPFCFAVSGGRLFDICFVIHVELKDFERVEQAPFFRTKVGCARTTGEMAWRPSPLRPSRVFFSHALKNEPKKLSGASHAGY